MIRIFILILVILVHSNVFSQTNELNIDSSFIKECTFNFKGFSTIINDFARDENGNYVFVGVIDIKEELTKDRDSSINHIFGLGDYSRFEDLGIIISTDNDLNIKHITKSFMGNKIVYNAAKKKFIIGASFLDYINNENGSFSIWKPVIITTNILLETDSYFIQKDYSCFLQDIILEGDEILIFTKSELNNSITKRSEVIEIIKVNTSKISKTSKKSWIKNLSPIETWRTPHEEMGRITMSEISHINGSYYFTTSNLNQSELKSTNHMYKFQNNNLQEVSNYSEFLLENTKYSDWIYINGSLVDSNYNFINLFHVAASIKELIFTKTDSAFNQILIKKSIPLDYYGDHNKFLVLSSDYIVILRVNEDKNWTYNIFDLNMNFIEEINTLIPSKYIPNKILELNNNEISCLFNIYGKSNEGCVFQIVKLNN